MAADEYSIQEASVKLGIPVQKLRRWDQLGILAASRTSGRHRRYSRELIDYLAESLSSYVPEQHSGELAAVKQELKEKRRIIQLLLASESRYRDLVETSHDLIWATDTYGRFTYLNNAALDIFGIAPNDMLGRCIFDFEARPSHISNRRFLATLKKHGEVKNFLTHLVNANGEDRWVGINARVSFDDDRRMVGIRGTARDITEQYLATEQIERLAKYDQLTELPNRVSLQQAIESATELGGHGALLLLDADHFKYVNDNFGHRAGDQLLVGIAGVLREILLEAGAEIYHLGGDEFAVHLPKCLRTRAVQVAEQVLEGVRQYRLQLFGQRGIPHLTVSIGIALYPFHGRDMAELLANVDIARYQAKDHGRNRCVLYDQNSNSIRSTHQRVHWARKLREVLDEDQLVLYSQPIVRLTDEIPVHHEILVRIPGENGRMILPGQFIGTAESIGTIREIDMSVVWKLLQHIQGHEEKGHKMRYSVNLSRVSISDRHWVKRFHKMLADSSVDLSQLVFEITETAAMSEVDVTLAFIRSLKEMGCRFALDDFGAGFSSFYFLKRFDVDYLKIDMSFVKGLATDEGNSIFIKALCEVAHGLNKQVIAEGIETRGACQTLLKMEVPFGQGFLFKRPALLSASSEFRRSTRSQTRQ